MSNDRTLGDYEVVFLHASNKSTCFLFTQSRGMVFLHAVLIDDKNYQKRNLDIIVSNIIKNIMSL